MVNVSDASGSVFVRSLDNFRAMGGFTESWGQYWVPIVATGIEDARRLGGKLPDTCACPGKEAKP